MGIICIADGILLFVSLLRMERGKINLYTLEFDMGAVAVIPVYGYAHRAS